MTHLAMVTLKRVMMLTGLMHVIVICQKYVICHTLVTSRRRNPILMVMTIFYGRTEVNTK